MIILLFLPSSGMFDSEKQKYTAYSEAGDPATMTLVNTTKNGYPTNTTGNFSLASVGDFGWSKYYKHCKKYPIDEP